MKKTRRWSFRASCPKPAQTQFPQGCYHPNDFQVEIKQMQIPVPVFLFSLLLKSRSCFLICNTIQCQLQRSASNTTTTMLRLTHRVQSATPARMYFPVDRYIPAMQTVRCLLQMLNQTHEGATGLHQQGKKCQRQFLRQE